MGTSLLILISGPYLSGSNGDETAIAANLQRMEDYALPIYKKGHIAVANRLLEKCDAVLRIPGASRGADLEMEKARAMGKRIYMSLEEIPEG